MVSNTEGDMFRKWKVKSIVGKGRHWKIKDVGGEKEINFFAVVELFRFLVYLWFVFMMMIGILLTFFFTKENYSEIIKFVFGSVNVCVFFDFAPSIYVLPSLFAIWPVLVFLYAIVSIFRAWISKEEKRISKLAFLLYSSVFVYFTLSTAVLSTSIAVQPDLKKPATIKLHTLPFTNMVIALTVLQISISWFGIKVCWKDLKVPKVFKFLTITFLISMVITSAIKILQHLNGILGYEYDESKGVPKDHGLIWSVRDDVMAMVCQLTDLIWMISVLVWPMFQSGYEMWQKFDTHGLVIKIGDNRNASNIVEIIDYEGPKFPADHKKFNHDSIHDIDKRIEIIEDEMEINGDGILNPVAPFSH